MNENTQSKPRPIFAVKNRRKIWFFLIPIIAVIIGLVIWAVWFSSIFAVDQVRAVNANDSELTQQQVMEIRAKAGVTAGDPIALVDADTAAREVAELPWVQSVEVRRGWPNEIVIAVETRTPVAKVSTGVGELAVDSSGNTFESADINGLPRIDAEGDALIAAVEVLVSLPENLSSKITGISAVSRDNVVFTLKSGATVRWGSSEEADFKAQVLDALLTRRAEIYDVSAPELPTTTNEKGPKED